MPYHTRQAPGEPRRVPSRSLFRIAQRLNVPPMGKEPVSAGSGTGGCNGVRFASRHCRLTIWPTRTNFASLIRDAVRLAAAALEGLFEHPIVPSGVILLGV